MVDDHGQILVPTLIGDFVHTDPGQIGEGVVKLHLVIPDPGDDRPHRPPRDPHQLRDRRLRRLRGQPGDLRVEQVGVTGLVPRPRDSRDRHPVDAAGYPRRIGFQLDPDRSGIQGPPPPATLALVIARAPPQALPTPAPHRPRRPHPRNQNAGLVVEFNVLDHCLLDTKQNPP